MAKLVVGILFFTVFILPVYLAWKNKFFVSATYIALIVPVITAIMMLIDKTTRHKLLGTWGGFAILLVASFFWIMGVSLMLLIVHGPNLFVSQTSEESE